MHLIPLALRSTLFDGVIAGTYQAGVEIINSFVNPVRIFAFGQEPKGQAWTQIIVHNNPVEAFKLFGPKLLAFVPGIGTALAVASTAVMNAYDFGDASIKAYGAYVGGDGKAFGGSLVEVYSSGKDLKSLGAGASAIQSVGQSAMARYNGTHSKRHESIATPGETKAMADGQKRVAQGQTSDSGLSGSNTSTAR